MFATPYGNTKLGGQPCGSGAASEQGGGGGLRFKTSAYTFRTSLMLGCPGQAVVRIGLIVQIVRLPQVLQRRGRGRSAHYEDISKGLFTRPVQIGARAVGWPDYEVDALIAAQVASTPPNSLRQLVRQLEERRATAATHIR